jgi:hypothetical protein
MRMLSERSDGCTAVIVCAEDELLNEQGTSNVEELFRR